MNMMEKSGACPHAQATETKLTFPFARPGIPIAKEFTQLLASDTISKVRLWHGGDVWLASKYDHVRAILRDNRFSASTLHENYPQVTESRGTVVKTEPISLIRLDPPDHTTLRRMLSAEFTVKRIEELKSMMEPLMLELVDEMIEKGPPVDFQDIFALALPSNIIARLLGVPYEDNHFFQEKTIAKLTLDTDPQEAVKAGEEIRQYVIDLMEKKNANPEAYDDMMGRMLIKHIRTGEITLMDAAATMELLLIAGHETTANMLSLGMLSLMQDRAAFESVRNDETGEVTRLVVEEILRYHAIVQQTAARVALEDIEVGGVTIRKGDGVLAMITPANHDPEKYVNPDKFDATRGLMPPHMAFGFGVHQCIGQPLARVEMAMAFRLLTKRFPNMHLAVPEAELRYKGNSMVHGVYKLPVAW